MVVLLLFLPLASLQRPASPYSATCWSRPGPRPTASSLATFTLFLHARLYCLLAGLFFFRLMR